MATHDNTPPDGAEDAPPEPPVDETAEHIIEVAPQAEGVLASPPIAHAPPPAVRADTTQSLNADVSGEDTGVYARPTGLALRVAVAESAPEGGRLGPFIPDMALGSELLGQLLSHKLTEGLQVPTPEAQARAKPYFDRWVQTARALGPGDSETEADADVERDEDAEGSPSHTPFAALPSAQPALGSFQQRQAYPGGRQYPIALSLLPTLDDGLGEGSGADASVPADAPASRAKRARPPAGAPSIRPAAPRRRQPAEVVPQDLLQKASDTALMWSEPSGGTSFRIDFADDFFQDAACIITVTGHDVMASFYVEDVNARRLLEAESRRLQDSLEARGLVHAQVRIVTGPPPQPFAQVVDDDRG